MRFLVAATAAFLGFASNANALETFSTTTTNEVRGTGRGANYDIFKITGSSGMITPHTEIGNIDFIVSCGNCKRLVSGVTTFMLTFDGDTKPIDFAWHLTSGDSKNYLTFDEVPDVTFNGVDGVYNVSFEQPAMMAGSNALRGDGRAREFFEAVYINVCAVPEPTSILMLGAGLIGLLAARSKTTASTQEI